MATAVAMWLRKRNQHTIRLVESPYDARIYLERAQCHEELQYPDLAAGDAYKALILTDEVLDESGEYHEEAVEAIGQALKNSHESEGDNAKGYLNGHKGTSQDQQEYTTEDQDSQDNIPWYSARAQAQSCSAYQILVRTLMQCGDLKAAWDFSQRGCRAFPTDEDLQASRARVANVSLQGQLQLDAVRDVKIPIPNEDFPKEGQCRREIYPWNDQEPERYTASNLALLNAELSKITSKCEVRAVELPVLYPGDDLTRPTSQMGQKAPHKTHKQLGLFATADLSPYEPIFHEPSILTANNRLHDTLCDACSSPLPTASPPLPTCPSCEDTVFCSLTCLDRAQELYHPAICDHPDFDASARDPSPAAATESLYLLLLARTIAMAETQNLHPLSLPEIRYLWGDFSPPPSSSSSTSSSSSRLPFSFQTQIQTPLHLLQNLNLNIFTPPTLHRYDTWVINTLMAKYRGVASAKMHPQTGVPEVCAVHWRWCLANHSCAPNVKWGWPVFPGVDEKKAEEREEEGKGEREEGGCMALDVRGGQEVVQWGTKRREAGVRKHEEILSHYCDVGLPVEARREWAAGALGGECVCERCVWEAGRREGEEMGGGAGVLEG